jgi:parallel beta-helix repeat protein
VIVIPPPPNLVAIVVTPTTATVAAGAKQLFTAVAKLSDGSTTAVGVNWTATGGTIDAGGTYTAGTAPGSYKVIATHASSPLADTVAVTISGTSTGGSTNCTSTATTLCPGDDIQAKANAAGAGATLTLQPGIYRMQSITPLNGQTFVGQPGAIISGAKLLTGWTQSGSTWYVGGQTQEFGHSAGRCESGTACMYPEDVYRDNVLLTRVLSLSAVGPGTFYFDYAADRIYVGDNPAGHTLEAAAKEYAFTGTAQGAGSGVTIRGLVIEKYANAAQTGAIGGARMPANWTVRENEVRFNHGVGIWGGNSGLVIARNNVHHNGQMGIASGFARVDSNEIAYNNTARYSWAWEAGGTKFAFTTNLLVRGNWVHHNRGPGLWTDINNVNTTYSGNTVEDNYADGILHEISYSATIRGNVVRRNGFGNPNAAEGAGITISSSGGTGIDISGNTVAGNKNGIILLQADRGSGSQGAYVVRNVSVHDNNVTLGAGQRTGAYRYGGDSGLWTANNNRFANNTYNLQSAGSAPFIWTNNAAATDAQWRGYGNDATGTFNR